MRKLVFIAVLCAFVATPALADFYGGKADYSQKYATGQGGEFRIEPDPVGFYLSNSAYAESTKNQDFPGSFQTFCIEVGESIRDNSHIKVSETYVNGNPGSHAYAGGTSNGDDLGDRTAYLYQQFALGTLTGYVYKTSGTGSVTFDSTTASFTRKETAGVLQRVLWRLEDEGTDWNATYNYYKVDLDRPDERKLADYWYSSSSLAVPSGFGVGNVRVLQLYECYNSNTGVYSGNRQDQLYLTPIPGAVILGILGLGVAGIKLRKFA